MAYTPKRLHGPALVTNSAATKYTVPSGTKTIIRHMCVQNPSASPIDWTFSIGTDAAGTRIRDQFTIGARQAYDYYCYIIMDASEILQSFASTTNILTLTINGDEIV